MRYAIQDFLVRFRRGLAIICHAIIAYCGRSTSALVLHDYMVFRCGWRWTIALQSAHEGFSHYRIILGFQYHKCCRYSHPLDCNIDYCYIHCTADTAHYLEATCSHASSAALLYTLGGCSNKFFEFSNCYLTWNTKALCSCTILYKQVTIGDW